MGDILDCFPITDLEAYLSVRKGREFQIQAELLKGAKVVFVPSKKGDF